MNGRNSSEYQQRILRRLLLVLLGCKITGNVDVCSTITRATWLTENVESTCARICSAKGMASNGNSACYENENKGMMCPESGCVCGCTPPPPAMPLPMPQPQLSPPILMRAPSIPDLAFAPLVPAVAPPVPAVAPPAPAPVPARKPKPKPKAKGHHCRCGGRKRGGGKMAAAAQPQVPEQQSEQQQQQLPDLQAGDPFAVESPVLSSPLVARTPPKISFPFQATKPDLSSPSEAEGPAVVQRDAFPSNGAEAIASSSVDALDVVVPKQRMTGQLNNDGADTSDRPQPLMKPILEMKPEMGNPDALQLKSENQPARQVAALLPSLKQDVQQEHIRLTRKRFRHLRTTKTRSQLSHLPPSPLTQQLSLPPIAAITTTIADPSNFTEAEVPAIIQRDAFPSNATEATAALPDALAVVVPYQRTNDQLNQVAASTPERPQSLLKEVYEVKLGTEAADKRPLKSETQQVMEAPSLLPSWQEQVQQEPIRRKRKRLRSLGAIKTILQLPPRPAQQPPKPPPQPLPQQLSLPPLTTTTAPVAVNIVVSPTSKRFLLVMNSEADPQEQPIELRSMDSKPNDQLSRQEPTTMAPELLSVSHSSHNIPTGTGRQKEKIGDDDTKSERIQEPENASLPLSDRSAQTLDPQELATVITISTSAATTTEAPLEEDQQVRLPTPPPLPAGMLPIMPPTIYVPFPQPTPQQDTVSGLSNPLLENADNVPVRTSRRERRKQRRKAAKLLYNNY